MTLAEKWRSSVRGLKSSRTIVVTGLMVAINLTLDLLNIRIVIAPQLRISFGFLTNAMVGMLYGPAPAMIAGAIGDIVGLMLNPTGAYFPGFTLTAILAGMVWGFCLYQEKLTFLRALFTRAIICIALNTFLNSFWMMIVYNQSLFRLRAVKNMLLMPVEAILLVVVGNAVLKIRNQLK